MKTENYTTPKQAIAGRRAILPYNGALTHENCGGLKQDVLSEIQRQRAEVILDFKHVLLLDSAALEVLVDLHETLKTQGKCLKIIRLQKLCSDILMATRLMHTLNTYDNLHAAITHSQ